MSRLSIHNRFHSKTNIQTKIITKSNFTHRIILSVFEEYLTKNNYSILDIGCGAGTLAFYLGKKGNHVLGIDLSNKAISACLRSKRALSLKTVSFKKYDFPTEAPKKQFNVVIFVEVIEHLANDLRALEKINKLLSKGGILILSTPSDTAPLYKLGLTRNFDKKVGHERRYSVERIENLLEQCGFQILEVKETEGILRNFLFVNPIAGKLVRFIKYWASDLITVLDNMTIPIFGSSDIIIVAKKRT